MSSFFDQSSLCLIPSGYKDSKLYSVKPTDGSGDLTFSRGSDIEATRVNSQGLIEKAKVNLLLQSNTFSTTWTKNNATLTSGQSGYDGTSDAWELKSAGSGTCEIIQSYTVTGVKTHSIYAKAGTISTLKIYAGSAKEFNLSTGTTASTNAKITSVGSGWYRCEVFETAQAFYNVYFTATAANDTIYIQDAQLNYGLVAQEYQETTTTSVVSGITNDMPRLDYSGGASCPSLLLEPSRTNLVTHSEFFGSADWAQTRMTTTANNAVSPEGVQNAALLANTTDTGNHTTVFNLGSLTNPSMAFSLFVKKKDNDFVQIGMYNSSTNWNAVKFNIETGSVLGSGAGGVHSAPTNATITSYGNGWYRISAVFAATITSATEQVYITATPTSATPTGAFGLGGGWTGATTENLWVYGAQAENSASYPTSYIPTYGTSVTRVQDACSKTGISSLIGTEGTLFVEFISGADDATNHILSLSDGTTSNRVSLVKNTSDDLRAFVASGGASQASILWPNYAPNTNIKTAISYKANEIKFYANGENAGTDTSALVPASLTQVEFETSGSPFAYPIKQLIIFPTALTATQMAELTA